MENRLEQIESPELNDLTDTSITLINDMIIGALEKFHKAHLPCDTEAFFVLLHVAASLLAVPLSYVSIKDRNALIDDVVKEAKRQASITGGSLGGRETQRILKGK